MAFRYVNDQNGGFSPAMIEVAKTNETAMAPGDLVVVDVGNNAVERATSAATVNLLFGICQQVRTASQTTVLVMPLRPGMVLEADTANDTHASNQTFERCALTDHDTLNNSGSDVTGDTGLFRILAPVGAVGDRKVLVQCLGPIGVST